MILPEGSDKKYWIHFPNEDEELEKICLKSAWELYGNPLPDMVEKRLQMELDSIRSNGYSSFYLLWKLLTDKSKEWGYAVSSRGSVGASLVAYFCGITDINPLAAHYYCPKCHRYEAFSDKPEYYWVTGYDIPDRECPVCNTLMNSDGFNIPFEVFAGLKGDKEPDIDLNFAEDIREDIYRYLREYFGEENVFWAGTISTVTDEMAAFRLLEYVEKTGELSGMGPVEDKRREEVIRKVAGTKRGMGMHPGGVIVVPKGADISEITPLQYLKKYTISHLGYHAFDGCVAKYDILGHYALSELHELEKRTGVRQSEIPFSDEKVLSLFQNARALGLKDRMPNGLSRFGTLGVNGFDSQFAWGLLATLEVECFSDLMRISALSHGTGCWFENADELSEKGKALRELISYRDDIMLFLESRGMDHDNAFKIMECVRKGRYQRRGITDGIDLMQKLGIPEWYIDSCKKILYLFPKAHTVSYAKMAWKLAFYKLYYPEEFYTVVLRHKRVPEEILKNRDSLDEQIRRMEEFRYELSFREREDLWTMYLIAEAGERGCDIRSILAEAV